MKKLIISSLVAASLAAVSMPTFAGLEETPPGENNDGKPQQVTVHGGTIHFEASVVNAACAVDANSINQTVQLGQFKLSDFSKKGDETSRIPFSIKLNSCDPEVASTAAITFVGTPADSEQDVFALQGAGAAKNIALKLVDSQNKQIAPGQVSTGVELIDGSNELNYSASLISTSDEVSAGNANAVTNFMVTYS